MRFKKPKNTLEGHSEVVAHVDQDNAKIFSCPTCEKLLTNIDITSLKICPFCRHHFRLSPRERIDTLSDADTFTELFADIQSENIINFPEYTEKLKKAMETSKEKEAVICGVCEIGGTKTAIFVMNPFFMMGSMGSAVGEKITLIFEYATKHSLPVLGFTVSGGARMQEGIVSLMQMAKTSGAVKIHSDHKNLFLCVLTDPTTGGVTASFAMEGDIILSEPKALIGFAGPRVIEQTIRKKLPTGFQKAEFLIEKGFIDDILDRVNARAYISDVLKMHTKREETK